MALKAGCDMLLFGGKPLIGQRTGLELQACDIQRIHEKIVQSVYNGDIPL